MLHATIQKRIGLKNGGINLDVRLTVNKEERIGLTGASGAGKTSLLRILAGLDRPDRGNIIIDGMPWVDTETDAFVPPARRNIGFVFQDYALFPNMTLRQSLSFASRKGKNDPMIAELIDIMGLTHHVHQRPSQLSGGQKQRAALARALIRSPRLLLMDEPLSALDRQTRKSLWRELNRIHERYPVSLILVSHDPEEIEILTDRSIMMHCGKIVTEAVFETGVMNDTRKCLTNTPRGVEEMCEIR